MSPRWHRRLSLGSLILYFHHVQGILGLEGVLPQIREGVHQGEGVVVMGLGTLNTTTLRLVGKVELSDRLLQLLPEVPLLV